MKWNLPEFIRCAAYAVNGRAGQTDYPRPLEPRVRTSLMSEVGLYCWALLYLVVAAFVPQFFSFGKKERMYITYFWLQRTPQLRDFG